MNKYIWIILGIGVVSYVSYRLYKSSRKSENSSKEEKEKIKPEVVDSLGMSDVIGYFKGLGLKEGVDKPFIAQGEYMKEGLDLSDPLYEGLNIICLGVYSDKSDELREYKALACKVVDEDVMKILGTDKMVVLS